ncbi:hypothetical protein [Falsiruegeria litorea]|nr:hypothetical protein [Falsiruegeria litorea]MBT8166860.1 hypothetical protein [Falsiruegeria litorea]
MGFIIWMIIAVATVIPLLKLLPHFGINKLLGAGLSYPTGTFGSVVGYGDKVARIGSQMTFSLLGELVALGALGLLLAGAAGQVAAAADKARVKAEAKRAGSSKKRST